MSDPAQLVRSLNDTERRLACARLIMRSHRRDSVLGWRSGPDERAKLANLIALEDHAQSIEDAVECCRGQLEAIGVRVPR